VHLYYPDAEGSFPLIVFSHGAFGYYQSNYSTYAELVSHGYVVAALDHPHHAFFTKNAQGKTVLVDFGFLSDAVDVSNGEKTLDEEFELSRAWMELRTGDMNFALDTLKAAAANGSLDGSWHTKHADAILSALSRADVDRNGLMGHSMGGATAVSLGRTRDDVDAVIVLDGTMLDELTGIENGTFRYNEEPYPVPVLDFGKKSDYSETEQAKDGSDITYVNKYVIDHAKDGKRVLFGNCGHMDFTDLPLFSPRLASMLGSEKIDHEAFLNRMNGLVLNWFDFYLKGNGTLDIQAEY
jgi:dienelactone hydrolase